VVVPAVDINRANFSYSARTIPPKSLGRFADRARSRHQPCKFFILGPDHPPKELKEVWWPCPKETSIMLIFHTRPGPSPQRGLVAVPGGDIKHAGLLYSARTIPPKSLRRFSGRARRRH